MSRRTLRSVYSPPLQPLSALQPNCLKIDTNWWNVQRRETRFTQQGLCHASNIWTLFTHTHTHVCLRGVTSNSVHIITVDYFFGTTIKLKAGIPIYSNHFNIVDFAAIWNMNCRMCEIGKFKSVYSPNFWLKIFETTEVFRQCMCHR